MFQLFFPRANVSDWVLELGKNLHVSGDYEKLRATSLNLSYDYYTVYRTSPLEKRDIILSTYLDDEEFEAGLLCPEMPLPVSLSEHFNIVMDTRVLASPNAVVQLHAGRDGCFAPMHFDWDGRMIAHVCLKGGKKFILIPPESGWLLQPVMNTSALCVPCFTDADRALLLDKLGGQEFDLEEGQGVIFPSAAWHGVCYNQTNLSASIRLETTLAVRPLLAFPRSWWLQRVVYSLQTDSEYPDISEFLNRMMGIFFTEDMDWYERYRAMHALYRSHLLEMGADKGVARWVDDNFSSELALAAEELEYVYSPLVSNDDIDSAEVAETRDYLFAGFGEIDRTNETKLAAYAVATRQGLRPKRGLVTVKEGLEE